MGRLDTLKGFSLCLATVMSAASVGAYIGKRTDFISDPCIPTRNASIFSVFAHASTSEPPACEQLHPLRELEEREKEARRRTEEYQANLARMRPILLAQRCTPLPQPPECYEVGLGIGQDNVTNPQSLYTTEKSSSLTPTEKGQP